MLSKEIRHLIYKKALSKYNVEIKWSIKNDCSMPFGLCNVILSSYRLVTKDFNNDDNNEHNSYNTMNNYPEILKHKPIDVEHPSYWFPTSTEDGIAKRISILKQAIEETK